MKVYLRLLACLVCLAAMLGLVSCGKNQEEGVPEGMISATCTGAYYRLYVPNYWTANTSYGVSGAYRALGQQSTVSVGAYPVTAELEAQMRAGISTNGGNPDGSGDRINWYAEHYCQASVKERALNEKIELVAEECIASELGGANAYQFRYSALINGQTFQFLQLVAERGSVFYVFTYTATEEMYDLYVADVRTMLEYFEYSETPYEPLDYAKEPDAEAVPPEGMKTVSGKDVAYRFYVPTDWKVDPDHAIYAAFVEADRTSVSVVPYMPAVESMRVSEYFTMCRDLMANTAGEGGFEMLSDINAPEKVDLGGREASVYEYRLRIGGETYRYRQYIAAYRSMIYSVTYTATEEIPEGASVSPFDAHLEELAKIVEAFQFR